MSYRKNAAPPNAMKTFYCDSCNKGYPRQPDYENHLRSYDHNHRQRMAEMRKITARNDAQTQRQAEKKRAHDDLIPMPVEKPTQKTTGTGPRFTKIGGGGGEAVVGQAFVGLDRNRFTKIGGPNTSGPIKGAAGDKIGAPDPRVQLSTDRETLAALLDSLKPEDKKGNEGGKDGANDAAEAELVVDSDCEMAGAYDFTKPTGCGHANCSGCGTKDIWITDSEIDTDSDSETGK